MKDKLIELLQNHNDYHTLSGIYQGILELEYSELNVNKELTGKTIYEPIGDNQFLGHSFMIIDGIEIPVQTEIKKVLEILNEKGNK